MSDVQKPLRVLVAGLGNMGRSHALAYHRNPGFEIAGVVNRSPVTLPDEMAGMTILPSFPEAMAELKPDVCSINTYSDNHADYAVMAMEAGAHVFVEKPLATTVEDAERVVACASRVLKNMLRGRNIRVQIRFFCLEGHCKRA